MKAIKIYTDGETELVDITGKDVSEQNDSIYEHLDGYFDIVRYARDAVCLVDDEGFLKEKPINLGAMVATGYPGPLVGTALIVGTRPGPEGDEFCDVPAWAIKQLDVQED